MMKHKLSAAKQNLLLALVINAVLLGVLLCFFTPYYETNDDILLSHFVDGSMAVKQSRMRFINIIIGTLFKGLYTLVPAAPWYALYQYAMIFAGFTAMTWILLQRWGRIPAIVLSVAAISFFGLDAYIRLQFTKTTAVAAVFGIMLMFYSLGKEKGTKSLRVPMVSGVILSLLGGMYRYVEMLAAGAVMCWIIIDSLVDAIKNSAGAKEKLHCVFDTIKPFILFLLLFIAIFAIDLSAYRDTEWAEYYKYNEAHSQVMDLGTPSYHEHK